MVNDPGYIPDNESDKVVILVVPSTGVTTVK